MTIPLRLAASAGAILMLCALPGAPSWGQQSVLRAQTDEVQRAIAEALRQANAGMRRDAAHAAAEQRDLRSPETAMPEPQAGTSLSDEAARPTPHSDRH
jgi:hypothetical protein